MNSDERLTEIRDLLAELLTEFRASASKHEALQSEYRAALAAQQAAVAAYGQLQRLVFAGLVLLGALATYFVLRT